MMRRVVAVEVFRGRDAVRLDCGHAAPIGEHDGDNGSLVGTETECKPCTEPATCPGCGDVVTGGVLVPAVDHVTNMVWCTGCGAREPRNLGSRAALGQIDALVAYLTPAHLDTLRQRLGQRISQAAATAAEGT